VFVAMIGLYECVLARRFLLPLDVWAKRLLVTCIKVLSGDVI